MYLIDIEERQILPWHTNSDNWSITQGYQFGSYLKHWFHFSSWSPEDIIIQEYASTYRLMIIQFSLVCFRAQNWYKTCIINYKVNISYTWFSNSSSTLVLWWISLFVGQKHNRNFCRGGRRCKSWLHNERRLCKL